MKLSFQENQETTIHTKISFYLVIVASILEIIVGLLYLVYYQPITEANKQFGIVTVMEGLLALGALFITDAIVFKKVNVSIRKINFQKPHSSKIFLHTLIIAVYMALIQLAFTYTPASIREFNKGLAYAFAGVCEEAFYRGFLMSCFIVLGRSMDKLEYSINNKRLISVSRFELFGVVFSAVAFMLFHKNYYGNILFMLSVLFSGLGLAFFFLYWKDITSCILAHFIVNSYFTITTIYMVAL